MCSTRVCARPAFSEVSLRAVIISPIVNFSRPKFSAGSSSPQVLTFLVRVYWAILTFSAPLVRRWEGNAFLGGLLAYLPVTQLIISPNSSYVPSKRVEGGEAKTSGGIGIGGATLDVFL